MADHMTAEQLRAELERIARWLTGEVCIVGDENGEAPATAHDYELDQAAGALHALAARLSGMAAVPEGWKLIPLLPTDKMLDAAQTNETGGLITREARARIFRAMALAAPEPPHV
jgi:hypothetical protein